MVAKVPAGWDANLTRTIVVKGEPGTLVTLGDTGNFIAGYFNTVVLSNPLEEALAALVKAAERGTRQDKEEATRTV